MLAALERILANLGFHLDLSVFIVMFALVVTRLVTAITFTPFLGGKVVPSQVKMGLAVVIGAIVFTSVAPQSNFGELTTVRVMSLFIKEAIVGATLGFLSTLIFQSVQMAGAMIDYGRGMSQATFFAPQLETNVSLLGQLQFQAALVLFLLLNGHLVFLRALVASYDQVPLLGFPQFSGGTLAAMEQMAHYTGDSLRIAVQLSAPALIALFLVDIGFGMIGKVASGFQVHQESQPVKSLLGLAVFLLAMAYILNRMPEYFNSVMVPLGRLIKTIA